MLSLFCQVFAVTHTVSAVHRMYSLSVQFTKTCISDQIQSKYFPVNRCKELMKEVMSFCRYWFNILSENMPDLVEKVSRTRSLICTGSLQYIDSWHLKAPRCGMLGCLPLQMLVICAGYCQ